MYIYIYTSFWNRSPNFVPDLHTDPEALSSQDMMLRELEYIEMISPHECRNAKITSSDLPFVALPSVGSSHSL